MDKSPRLNEQSILPNNTMPKHFNGIAVAVGSAGSGMPPTDPTAGDHGPQHTFTGDAGRIRWHDGVS